MLNNLLQVSLAEFKRGTKVFQRKRLRLGPVLLAYESGFLAIESGEVTTVCSPAHVISQSQKVSLTRMVYSLGGFFYALVVSGGISETLLFVGIFVVPVCDDAINKCGAFVAMPVDILRNT